MIRKAFFLTVALLLPALSQAQVKLLRHPTYSNGKVAFSYLGDLWIANENGSGVQRLTDNQARDVYPRFSPDGNWIAFSSNREGNYDVYVIPATGGKPRQLTFHSADDSVVNWTPDGKNIIFTSARGNGVFPSAFGLSFKTRRVRSPGAPRVNWCLPASTDPKGRLYSVASFFFEAGFGESAIAVGGAAGGFFAASKRASTLRANSRCSGGSGSSRLFSPPSRIVHTGSRKPNACLGSGVCAPSNRRPA